MKKKGQGRSVSKEIRGKANSGGKGKAFSFMLKKGI